MFLFKTKKQKLFLRKIDDVQIAIWELDFKIAKSRMIREGVRQDRERAIEGIQRVDTALAVETTEERKKALEAEKVRLEENVGRFEKQMAMVDKQINGFLGNETEEPVIGMVEQIASYAELREMYKEHLNTI